MKAEFRMGLGTEEVFGAAKNINKNNHPSFGSPLLIWSVKEIHPGKHSHKHPSIDIDLFGIMNHEKSVP